EKTFSEIILLVLCIGREFQVYIIVLSSHESGGLCQPVFWRKIQSSTSNYFLQQHIIENFCEFWREFSVYFVKTDYGQA
ncbi:MAG: hypothetical protein IIY78_10705, partial [Clostridia bacterium]|nr:hypothetical protein [Clostridia bacterium]